MAWVKQNVWVLTAWLREYDEDGEPINWSSPSEEYFAFSYAQALAKKEELLQDRNIEDVWISDEPEERELWESNKVAKNKEIQQRGPRL